MFQVCTSNCPLLTQPILKILPVVQVHSKLKVLGRASSTSFLPLPPQCVVDHVNYYMDLNKTSQSKPPVWEFEYCAKESYDMPDLQPQSWADLVLRMQKNNSLLLEYFQYVCYTIK